MSLTVSPEEIVAKSKSPLLAKHPDWPRVKLGEVTEIVNGAAFESRFFNADGVGLPLVRIRDVGKQGTGTFYSGQYEGRHLLGSGDLLIGMDGDFRIAEWHGGAALLNQRVCKLVVADADRVNPRFLLHVLPAYLDAIHAHTSSVTVKHLSSKTILDLPIPLPSIDVQESLVEEIETQLTRMVAAEAALARGVVNLNRYQAAFLRDVFGLTVGRWSLVPLGTICTVHVGATPSRKVSEYWDGPIPWVVSQDLHSRYVSETQETITATGLANSSTQLHPTGTVLLGMIGQGPTRGMAAVLKVEACTSQNLAALRPRNEGQVRSEWLMYFFDSQYEKIRRLGSGNNQKALNKSIIESIEIPLPSRSIQDGLIDRIDAELSILKETRRILEHERIRSRALRRAVLIAALSGQLAGRQNSDARGRT
jgi:type I restriction enzyme, S subunit